MRTPRNDHPLQIRAITPSDLEPIQHLMRQSSRIYVGTRPEHFGPHLLSAHSWLAESGKDICGFVCAEMRPFSVSVITNAAVSHGQSPMTVTDALLPQLEQSLKSSGAETLAQVGFAPWLVDILDRHGFHRCETVITYRREGHPVAIGGNLDINIGQLATRT